MIVDDDAEMRTLLAEYFRRLGFEVAEKENGSAALQAVANDRFDCFILDVAMPEARVAPGDDAGLPLKEASDRFERQYVLRVLERTQWNVSRAARLLGVHRNTVLTKLAGWGVQRPGGTGAGDQALSL